ncbi:hypothetical protein ACJJI4_18305 [Microbulbifer sp. TRSA002]|uniref:hypothetical protein n=1 Tax=Microbulbifer sp. TRSA002 TaxID=3243382 RepID=UPI00403917A6
MNHPTIGEYRALGIDLQGANIKKIKQLRVDIQGIQDVLASGDQAQIERLTKSEIVGSLLYSTVHLYLALTYLQDQLEAKASNIVNYRMPSFGIFSTSLQANYFFGVPRSVHSSGLLIDIDRLSIQAIAKDNDRKRLVNHMKAIGYRASAMEHDVPEQIFSTEDIRVQGISAVKALKIAVSEGQRIWTIDINNISEALSVLDFSSDVKGEIRNAVLAGKVVTTHEKEIDFAGGKNLGYLLIDPDTGAGAYLIANGASGGFLSDDDAGILGAIGLFTGTVGAAFTFTPLIVVAVLLAAFLAVELYLDFIALNTRCDALVSLIAVAIIVTILGALVAPLLAIVLAYTALLAGNGAIVAAGSSSCREGDG